MQALLEPVGTAEGHIGRLVQQVSLLAGGSVLYVDAVLVELALGDM